MRDIKFRAWNKNNKRMFFDIQNKAYIDDYDSPVTFDEWLSSPRDWDVMQFTGLKDMNGKEIYEGDILKRTIEYLNAITDTCEKCGQGYIKEEVIEKTSDFMFVESDDTYFFKVTYIDKDAIREGMLKDTCDKEVVGNIYENPELLSPAESSK